MTLKLNKDQTVVHIRWCIQRDMPEVLKIEEEAYEPETAWTENDFLLCLRRRNCIGMVSEKGDEVIGYMFYELHKAKLHVLKMAVHPSWRRRRVGTQLISKLVSKLTPDRRNRIVALLRETNLPAQLFFRSNGFRAISTMKRKFDDTKEDAYLFQYRLPGIPEEAP